MELYDGWPFPPGGKLCPKCRQWLMPENYYAAKTRSSGHMSYCKPCHNELTRSWQSRNKEKCRKAMRECRQKQRTELQPAYIRKILQIQDIPPLPQLIEAKRLQLQLHRKTKQVRSLVELEDAYTRRLLRKQNIPPLPQLVEAKRLQLQLHRMTNGQAHQ